MNATVKLAVIGVAVALGSGYITNLVRPYTAGTLGASNDLIVALAAAAAVAITVGKVL